jgi:hypothetical protein
VKPSIAAEQMAARVGGTVSDKTCKLEPVPFVGTISELIEKLAESVESWNPVEKAIFRASLTGKLGPTSERIQ